MPVSFVISDTPTFRQRKFLTPILCDGKFGNTVRATSLHERMKGTKCKKNA